ncbi:hypothetical protein KIN20_005140 [Parelaphostrongylus tenuis]|uniref:Uncharacterized protein n=1 Tax=Parelaphostrongylus tenuis TaxID=148309 RepID=A0AAD5M1N7_PARTN|nr:hypothetical protein KIN20_005140 [Parelaphostrongylus tenuis]
MRKHSPLLADKANLRVTTPMKASILQWLMYFLIEYLPLDEAERKRFRQKKALTVKLRKICLSSHKNRMPHVNRTNLPCDRHTAAHTLWTAINARHVQDVILLWQLQRTNNTFMNRAHQGNR